MRVSHLQEAYEQVFFFFYMLIHAASFSLPHLYLVCYIILLFFLDLH